VLGVSQRPRGGSTKQLSRVEGFVYDSWGHDPRLDWGEVCYESLSEWAKAWRDPRLTSHYDNCWDAIL
jgi:hypothetical protein